ncbi:MAG: hypothetical protein DRP89_07915 [Candidatus Neomarinimicrobiota bacterium]|nr:MAG: hypothetical protein DRP89_07915 [Candidatus Neomarinimicrobiota bacterium]
MAKKKSSWGIYVAVLAIAILLLLVVRLKENKYEQKVTDIFNVDVENVNAFTITKGEVSVTLMFADTTWIFAEPDTGKVKQFRINNFLSNVVKGKKTGFATDKPEKYSQYNITDELGTKVELKKGETVLASVIVGKSKASWAQDYIRYPNDPKVYITQKKLLNYLSEKASFWR